MAGRPQFEALTETNTPIKPTSPSLAIPLGQLNLGQATPTYRRGKSVQTTGTTSGAWAASEARMIGTRRREAPWLRRRGPGSADNISRGLKISKIVPSVLEMTGFTPARVGGRKIEEYPREPNPSFPTLSPMLETGDREATPMRAASLLDVASGLREAMCGSLKGKRARDQLSGSLGIACTSLHYSLQAPTEKSPRRKRAYGPEWSVSNISTKRLAVFFKQMASRSSRVDTKKEGNWVGNFKNAGREWRPKRHT